MQRRPLSRERSRLGMSRVEFFVAVFVIGCLLAMLAPAIQSPRPPARRMECQHNLKNIALATMVYASANSGQFPMLEDGESGWPAALLPYLDQAALHRWLKEDRQGFETELRRSNAALRIKVFTCPLDGSNVNRHLSLSYVANAGWGRFRVNEPTDEVFEREPHSINVDWDNDGEVTEEERLLVRSTGAFWRAHPEVASLTLDEINEGDGQSHTMLFTENTNARNWPSRETFDIGFVVGLDRITFEPTPEGHPTLNVKSANLGPFAIRSKPRVMPGRSPAPSSYHTGLFNVAFADGRVESVNVNIDPRVFLARMTWNGHRCGEPPARQH